MIRVFLLSLLLLLSACIGVPQQQSANCYEYEVALEVCVQYYDTCADDYNDLLEAFTDLAGECQQL